MSLTIEISNPEIPHATPSGEIAYLAHAAMLAVAEFQRGSGLVTEGDIIGVSVRGVSHSKLGSWKYTSSSEAIE